jgi:hypothetical protein
VMHMYENYLLSSTANLTNLQVTIVQGYTYK